MVFITRWIENVCLIFRALKNVPDLNKSFKKAILDELKPTVSSAACTSRRDTNQRRPPDGDDDDPLRVPGTGSRRPRPYPEW